MWIIGRMNVISKDSYTLAEEYVPEVEIAAKLRGGANRVMYQMRGFGLTEDTSFFRLAQKEIELVEEAIAEAKKLDVGS